MSDTSTTATDVIPFRSARLLLVNCGGQPFVPMKPVVEGMGLDWKTQHRKLVDGRFKSTVVEMTIVAADGKLRPMVCLPLRKLAGWLMSIHPEKIKDEGRKRLILEFQDECDDVLWSYWNEGVAIRTHDRDATTVISELIGMSELNVIKALIRDKAKVVPAAMHQSFVLTMHRRLHTRFNVPRTEMIPASQFDQACNFIGSYALEGEYLPHQAISIPEKLGQTERYLVSAGPNGERQVTSVPFDACIMTVPKLIGLLGKSSELMVTTDDLFLALHAIADRLHGRSSVQARRFAA